MDSIIEEEELGALDAGRVEEVLAKGLGHEANVRLAIAVDFTKVCDVCCVDNCEGCCGQACAV
mgnify:CR=1 FL=1